MRRHLFLSAISITSLLAISDFTNRQAVAQIVCYDNGINIVDMGDLCTTWLEPIVPAPIVPAPVAPATPQAPASTAIPTDSDLSAVLARASSFVYDPSQTSFPAYLFDRDLDNETPYRTDLIPYVDTTLFIYQNRFIEQFAEWPYVATASNRAEWTYLDCQTGWQGLKSSPWAGTSRDFFIPPEQSNMTQLNRNLCQTAGLQAQF